VVKFAEGDSGRRRRGWRMMKGMLMMWNAEGVKVKLKELIEGAVGRSWRVATGSSLLTRSVKQTKTEEETAN